MKFELREYQRQAATDVLRNLRRAFGNYREESVRSSFSLSALTGAGKTVIATAVIEAILNGSSEMGTDPRPDTTFLWLTDDRALNAQTRDRMLQASDRLAVGQLNIIDSTFDQAEFDPGKVYFLNTQKLSSSTSYVKSKVDAREHSLWDTISNTAKSQRTDLVLILDEAHRGMKPVKDKKTVVRQIIDGYDGNPSSGVPIVWGISATVDRFEAAMKGTVGREHLLPIQVSTDLIRASGLVKDRVILDSPNESGAFNTSMLRDAVQHLRLLDGRWNAYTGENHLAPVKPLMVIQVPDKATDQKLGELVATIAEEWPGHPEAAFAHVLGEHGARKAAGRSLRYVSPERVQDDLSIRFLFAKESITTGWDCPRAEVLYSERPGKEETYIAQLIGRIVRTPLAKRVIGDENLSSVACFLPLFDEETVKRVIDRLESGDDAAPVPVVRKTADYRQVPDLVEEGVYEVLADTPCEPTPSPLANPIIRARKLAMLLNADRLLPGAPKVLRQKFNSRLDGLAAEHSEQLAKNIDDVEHVEVLRTQYVYGEGATTVASRRTSADAKNVRDAYRTMVRKLRDGVGEDYSRHLTDKVVADGTPEDEIDYMEVQAHIAGLLMIDGIVDDIESLADTWARGQLEEHRVAIRSLNAEQRAAYDSIQGMASQPERVSLLLPTVLSAATEEADGSPVATWEQHAYQDAKGVFAAKLNNWEREVLAVESARPDFVTWYRNPSAATAAAVRIAYLESGSWRSLQPDLIVISRRADGSLTRSILDPHGDYLADSLPKLQALASYAEKYQDELHRVEPAVMVGDELRILDLTDTATRAAVLAWGQPAVRPLFEGEHSRLYK